jgi:cyclopropane-fatty-acyl-phospholipid synthase
MGQAAARVARAVGAFVETKRSGARPDDAVGALPVRIRAWDGSEAGAPADSGAPVVVLNHRRALRRLLWQPGEMGLAHAYVSGDLDVDGDLGEGLAAMWGLVRDGAITPRKPRIGELPGVLGNAARLGLLGPKPAPPPEAIKLPRFARLHSKLRDRAVIHHHYDAGNAFYELILDRNMAYSSGYWADLGEELTPETLAAAQDAKLDMICRKLGLGPDSTLLDVGCGWGSLPIHAAKHFGAQVRGVTIAAEQRDHINQRIRAEGLAGKVQVDLVDYRDIATQIEEYGTFDAVSSIEMGEHVGDENYPTFAATLFGALHPGGRALVQQMSRRPADSPGGGAFIETYVTPDMVMRPVGDTLTLLQRAGLEVRDVHVMRDHYVPTVRAWLATLEANWDTAVALAGVRGARMWRLYLVGGALAFEENRMGVDQILLTRPTTTGRSGMPATRVSFEPAPDSAKTGTTAP